MGITEHGEPGTTSQQPSTKSAGKHETTVAKPSPTRPAVQSSPSATPSTSTSSATRDSSAKTSNAVDAVAEKLFGEIVGPKASTTSAVASAAVEPRTSDPNLGPSEHRQPSTERQRQQSPPKGPAQQQTTDRPPIMPPPATPHFPSEGYYQPMMYPPPYPNAAYGVHPHGQPIWFPQPNMGSLPSSGSTSNPPSTGPLYSNHGGGYWPGNQAPPMMYPGSYGQYPAPHSSMPPHPPQGSDRGRHGPPAESPP